MVSILITCCNAAVVPAIATLLKKSNFENLILTGVDSSPLEYGLSSKFFDHSYRVPQGTNEREYVEAIKKICIQQNVDVILAGSDEELLTLKEHVEEINTTVIGSKVDTLNILADKLKLCEILAENNLGTPKFKTIKKLSQLQYELEELGFPQKPVVIKPRFGRGSRGLKLIKNKIDKFVNFNNKVNHEIELRDLTEIFENHEEELEQYIFMEYLEGDKYSADILVDNGNPVNMVIRNNGKNPKVSPPTVLADIVFDEDIYEYSNKVCELLKLDDFAQIEVGRDLNGELKIIEINGRLDASLAITMGLELNYYALLVEKAIHNKFPDNIPYPKSSSQLI